MSTDREREALARSVREKARSALGRATGPDLQGDNLGIALLTHISPAHPDEEHDDCGWPLSAVDAVNAIFDDAIANLLAAGWMPRPEPGSPEWQAMVERGARAIWEQPGSGCSWDRLAQHVRGQCINDATACLRAALDTGESK